MKHSIFFNLLIIGLVASIGGTGCKSVKKPVTPIPARQQTPPANPPPNPQLPVGPTVPPDDRTTSKPITPTDENGNKPLAGREEFEGREVDREAFKTDTVYFDFDKSSVKPAEAPKVETVVDFLKKNPNDALLIEGHCDERGTEEYNRALGERRALALRELAIKLGIDPERVGTISYGEDRPADPGHNEQAWSKNRRGEFVRLLPKK
jgi:peptidoglycan-associated lipoprotein